MHRDMVYRRVSEGPSILDTFISRSARLSSAIGKQKSITRAVFTLSLTGLFFGVFLPLPLELLYISYRYMCIIYILCISVCDKLQLSLAILTQ